ncbi:MAG TPA: L-seryl-tRNA(Sec) selenium transferase [Haliangiales bacterium]|nr:L-seryl-tRNA(Sec) selenium transferase [Haliangiales bacterium]
MALRDLPKVDDVLRRPELADLGVPRWALLQAVRHEIDRRRRALLDGQAVDPSVPSADVARRARTVARPGLRPVINATGVVLHTNLGRAPLALRAIERVVDVARGYSNLEYALDDRARGDRQDHVAAKLELLSGAEDALVVNNNAAAVLVGLAALAAGREVIVSRGELVEIGGSFRVPDVMRESGARLIEVGTTNKTHARDYEAALGPGTALLLKVSRSNFVMTGFVSDVAVDELAAIGHGVGVGVMVDLGSSSFLPESRLSSLVQYADIISFSGDKLLGGAQAGIILGRTVVVEKIAKHPLMRAVRPDKLTLAALEATLDLYLEGRADEIPSVRMLAEAPEAVRTRAERLRALVDAGEVVPALSAVGGGSLPGTEPPSWALALDGPPDALEAALRGGDPPVVARVGGGKLLLDLRTVADDEVEVLARAVRAASKVP